MVLHGLAGERVVISSREELGDDVPDAGAIAEEASDKVFNREFDFVCGHSHAFKKKRPEGQANPPA